MGMGRKGVDASHEGQGLTFEARQYVGRHKGSREKERKGKERVTVRRERRVRLSNHQQLLLSGPLPSFRPAFAALPIAS